MKNTMGAIMLGNRQCRMFLVTLLLIMSSCDSIGAARARRNTEDSSNGITPHDITRSAIAMQLSTIIEGHRKDADAVALSYGWDATEGMYLEAENKIDAVYIAQVVNADTTYCTATFRGTSFRQVQDWFVNLDLDPVPMSRLSSPTSTSTSTPPRLPCEVHGGYYEAYMQFEYRPRVETFLQNCHTKCHQNSNNKNKNHNCETVLIGHSQGGGIAEIAAVHYLQQQQQQQEEVQDVRPSCNPGTGCSNKNRTPTTTTITTPPVVAATTAIDSDNAENQKETEGGGAAAANTSNEDDTIVIWCDPRTGCSNKNRGTLADTTSKNNDEEDQEDKVERPPFNSDNDSDSSSSSSTSHYDKPYVLTFGGVPALGAGCKHLSVLQDIEQRRRWFRYIMTKEGGKKLVYDPIPMVFAQLLDPPEDADAADDDDDDRTISSIVDTLFDGKVTVLNRFPATTLDSSYARHGGLAYIGHELLLSVEDPSVMYQTGFDQHRYVDLAYIDVTGMAHHVDPYYNTLRAQDEFYNGNNSNNNNNNNNNAFMTPVRADGFGKGSLCNPEEESLTGTATTTTATTTCGTGLVCAAEKEAGASWWSLAFWDTTPKYICQKGTKEQEQQSSSSLPSSSSVSLDKNSASDSSSSGSSNSSSSSTLRPSVSPSIGIPTARSSTSTMESTAPATTTMVPSVLPNGRSDTPGDRDTAAATDGSESSRSPVVLSTTITPVSTTVAAAAVSSSSSSTMMASSSSSPPRSSGAEWMKVLFSTATTTILLVVVFVSSMFV